MNKLSGIPTLNAGAPDLRLSGEHNRGSYVQRRRAQMAGGGITGARKHYLFGKFGDWVGDVKDKIVDDIIPNELKNPLGIAALTAATTKLPIPGVEGWLGRGLEALEDVPYVGPVAEGLGRAGEVISNIPSQVGSIFTDDDKKVEKKNDDKDQDLGFWRELLATALPGGDPGFIDLYKGTSKDPSIFRTATNVAVPLGIGKWAHDVQEDYLAKQPKFPADETGIKFQTAQEAMADPNLRFKPEAQYANVAEGGRIGYALGKSVEQQKDVIRSFAEYKSGGGRKQFASWYNDVWLSGSGAGMPEIPQTYMASAQDDWPENMPEITIRKPIPTVDGEPIDIEDWKYMAQGGRIRAQEGGLMNLGGMEKDYREEGGFVPIGGQEKADDVPARLSKNEFVFTADAVRSAGGGDIDEGAAVMERLMNNLEAGGKVSEESQGLEGAQEMFANTQRLQNRII